MFEANNLISGVRYAPTINATLSTKLNVNINYEEPFSDSGYVNDGTTPPASGTGSEDHAVTLIRAVECYSNVYGMITADEVVENVAWLAGRFVSGALTNDGVDLPKDGIIPSESEEDEQEGDDNDG